MPSQADSRDEKNRENPVTGHFMALKMILAKDSGKIRSILENISIVQMVSVSVLSMSRDAR